MEIGKKVEEKVRKPRAQKFANLIKKGRNGLVNFKYIEILHHLKDQKEH